MFLFVCLRLEVKQNLGHVRKRERMMDCTFYFLVLKSVLYSMDANVVSASKI